MGVFDCCMMFSIDIKHHILYKKAAYTTISCDIGGLAGETRFEHATYGFGDRYSTVEPLP